MAAAVDGLVTRPDVDPRRVGAVGFSMGGEQAIGAAAADPRLRAVVAEGATRRTAADAAWYGDAYGLRGRLQHQVDRWTDVLVDAFTDASPPTPLREAVARAVPTPVLLIAAGEVGEEGLAAEHVRGGSPATVTVWEVPGAGHIGGLDTAPEEWERRVVGFLDAALGVA